VSDPAPELGEHTIETLRAIGIPEAHLRELAEAGVIGARQVRA
jgi:hypothetical protein